MPRSVESGGPIALGSAYLQTGRVQATVRARERLLRGRAKQARRLHAPRPPYLVDRGDPVSSWTKPIDLPIGRAAALAAVTAPRRLAARRLLLAEDATPPAAFGALRQAIGDAKRLRHELPLPRVRVGRRAATPAAGWAPGGPNHARAAGRLVKQGPVGGRETCKNAPRDPPAIDMSLHICT